MSATFEDLEVWKRSCRLTVRLYLHLRRPRGMHGVGFSRLYRSNLIPPPPSPIGEGGEEKPSLIGEGGRETTG
jgi:hypothetical protein